MSAYSGCRLAALGTLATLGVHGSAGAVASAVALAVWGVFGWSFSPIQQHRLVELAPPTAGLVLSLNASAVYFGIALGGLLGSVALGPFRSRRGRLDVRRDRTARPYHGDHHQAVQQIRRPVANGWAVTRCGGYWLWSLEKGLTIDPVR
ncbi:hypothetical protein OHA25_38255 [Nonomuraea sp. NBC_00507]|uniref:hypothetical protein n=1 Tax=Nonomuraea sp. NBC_00507 TaxID=2976002 RepID=UPI002E18C9A2